VGCQVGRDTVNRVKISNLCLKSNPDSPVRHLSYVNANSLDNFKVIITMYGTMNLEFIR